MNIKEQFAAVWGIIKRWDIDRGSSERNQYSTATGTDVDSILSAINSVDLWVKTSQEEPPINTIVLGFNKKWMNEDYNPEGVRQCFLYDDGAFVSTYWNNEHDCFETEMGTPPTHWMQHTKPPKN